MIPQSPAALLIDAQGDALAGGDAFGRLRVSQPHTLFDSKLLADKQPLLFAEKLTGGGTSTHLPNEAATSLAVTATVGDAVIRQTRRYLNYQSGKSHLIFNSFAGASQETGCLKRIGYFDANDGLFLEVAAATIKLVRRSSASGAPVDDGILQAAWNIDPMDGSGPSGITLDVSKSQILAIDLEWLGVGSARLGFVIAGCLCWCHAFRHANDAASTGVYMATPNLPVRWQISTDGSGAGTLKAICCSVQSEGGQEDTGVHRSVDRGRIGQSVDADLEPLISFRLKSGRRDTVLPEALQVMCSTGGNLRWVFSINPIVTGGAAAVWVSVPDSAVEFDITRDGTIAPADEGHKIRSGYSSADMDQLQSKVNGLLAIAADVDGVSDIWVLSAQNAVAAGAETVFAALGFLELG